MRGEAERARERGGWDGGGRGLEIDQNATEVRRTGGHREGGGSLNGTI